MVSRSLCGQCCGVWCVVSVVQMCGQCCGVWCVVSVVQMCGQCCSIWSILWCGKGSCVVWSAECSVGRLVLSTISVPVSAWGGPNESVVPNQPTLPLLPTNKNSPLASTKKRNSRIQAMPKTYPLKRVSKNLLSYTRLKLKSIFVQTCGQQWIVSKMERVHHIACSEDNIEGCQKKQG